MTPALGITLGDPAGVGPEVILRAAVHPRLRGTRLVVIGDLATLRETATRLRIACRPVAVDADPRAAGALPLGSRRTRILPVLTLAPLGAGARRPGRPTDAGARASYRWIEAAARLALQGAIAGIVTGPINKERVTRAGFPISGHTELLQRLTGARDVRMMLAGPRLRVVLVTMHVAHRAVAGVLRTAGVARTILVADAHLRRYHLARPRLGVAGLNPHAGEGGLFGREEQTVIAPAVARARRAGVVVSGPHAPDTVFVRAVGGEFDAVIAMYHDQGLIPLKLLHFHDAVNVTLGLPVVRTSPDHGTAYDIAGEGVADPGSMIEAIALAARMTRRRARPAPAARRRSAR